MSSSGCGALAVPVLHSHRVTRELSPWQVQPELFQDARSGWPKQRREWNFWMTGSRSFLALSAMSHVCLSCTACALWAFLEDSHQGRNASMDFINFRVMSCTASVGKGEGSWEEGLILHITPTVTALMAQMDFSLILSVMGGLSFSS